MDIQIAPQYDEQRLPTEVQFYRFQDNVSEQNYALSQIAPHLLIAPDLAMLHSQFPLRKRMDWYRERYTLKFRRE